MLKGINESFKEKINKPLLSLAFIIYLIIVIWIIFFKCAIPYFAKPNKWILEHSILDDFKFTIFYLPLSYKIYFTFIDIFCNLLILIPLGLYLPILFNKKNLLRDSLITLLMVFCFEAIQLFTRIGQFSLLDILWNVGGMLIGEFLYFKLEVKLTNQVVNYIQLFVVVLFLPIAIYAVASVPLNWNIYSPIFDYEKYPYILM